MIPYIASLMLDVNDSTYFNVKGVHILDPMINHNEVMQDGIVPCIIGAVATLLPTELTLLQPQLQLL